MDDRFEVRNENGWNILVDTDYDEVVVMWEEDEIDLTRVVGVMNSLADTITKLEITIGEEGE